MLHEDTDQAIRCPYCGSGSEEEACSHNLVVIDRTFNDWCAGYSCERRDEFCRTIEEYFLQDLRNGIRKIAAGKDKLIGELWKHAVQNYALGDEEISIDQDVLTDLIINLFEGSGGQTHIYSEDGPPGFSSSMRVVYAKKPKIVFDAALAKLRARLKKTKLPRKA